MFGKTRGNIPPSISKRRAVSEKPTAPSVGSGAPHDLMIPGFDNQRANFSQTNANKIRINARKR
jgi:hypothetical protein